MATETGAKHAAILAATYAQAQRSTRTLAFTHQQGQQQEEKQKTVEMAEVATQLDIQKNETRMAEINQSAPAVTNEQKEQESATNAKTGATMVVKSVAKRILIPMLIASLPYILAVTFLVLILMAIATSAKTHPWATAVQFGFGPVKVIWDIVHGS